MKSNKKIAHHGSRHDRDIVSIKGHIHSSLPVANPTCVYYNTSCRFKEA